eukprot:2226634-Pyramimonas_sp.AAC.1
MSYDETAELPVGSHVVQRDGQEHQDSGPREGRFLSSSNTTRISRGRVGGEVIDVSVTDSPTRIPIRDRKQTPNPIRRDGTAAN